MSRLRLRIPALHAHLTSFLFFMDLKVGATIITLFALFNKIAGVFGIIAFFQGGTLSQISLYVYSIASIVVFLWALQGIADEDSGRTLRYAHAFMADHMISSTWTLFFALWWYVYTPHDGAKPQLAAHQAGLMDLIESIEKSYIAPGDIKHHAPLEGEERIQAAQTVWKGERGFSATVLVGGWLLKIYFALVIYAFALHLRHGTYRSLPMSKASTSGGSRGGAGYRPLRGGSLEGSGPGGAARFSIADEEDLPAWSEGEESDDDGKPNKAGHSAAPEMRRSASGSRSAGQQAGGSSQGNGGRGRSAASGSGSADTGRSMSRTQSSSAGNGPIERRGTPGPSAAAAAAALGNSEE